MFEFIILHKNHIRKYDFTKYLALFHLFEKYERIFDLITYLIMLKDNIMGFYYHK